MNDLAKNYTFKLPKPHPLCVQNFKQILNELINIQTTYKCVPQKNNLLSKNSGSLLGKCKRLPTTKHQHQYARVKPKSLRVENSLTRSRQKT